jgi:hypothetical protein
MRFLLAESREICNSEHDIPIQCQKGELIMMTSAEYERKEVVRCIRKPDDFMGAVQMTYFRYSIGGAPVTGNVA